MICVARHVTHSHIRSFTAVRIIKIWKAGTRMLEKRAVRIYTKEHRRLSGKQNKKERFKVLSLRTPFFSFPRESFVGVVVVVVVVGCRCW